MGAAHLDVQEAVKIDTSPMPAPTPVAPAASDLPSPQAPPVASTSPVGGPSSEPKPGTN